MILVLLGTQNNDFHRLLDEIEKNIANGNINDQVIVQAGFTKYKSDKMKIFSMTSKENLEDLIKKADLIITHAGVGSIEMSLEHNKKVTKELEKLIESNKKRTISLNEKTETLKKSQETLKSKINSLEGSVTKLQEGAASASEQVRIYQKRVDYYKKQGCKPSDEIGVDCAKGNVATGWYRPTETGTITQDLKMSSYSIDGFHYGVDIISHKKNRRKEKIYPIAEGEIVSTADDIYGAHMVVIHHRDMNGKKWSSLYCHLSKLNPNIYDGMKVGPNTYIGYMGDTGYAFGVHLHLEVADCWLYTDKKCISYGKWASYIKNKFYNEGFNGARTLIKLPYSWSSR